MTKMTYEEIRDGIFEELTKRPCPKSGSFVIWVDKQGNIRWGWYYLSHEPYAFVSFRKALWGADFNAVDWGQGEEGDEDYVAPEDHWDMMLELWLMEIEEKIRKYLSEKGIE